MKIDRWSCISTFAVILFLSYFLLSISDRPGWDALTYHGPKAALWMQHGGYHPFIASGAWESYNLFPPNGSIVLSTGMLLFRAPQVIPWIDLIQFFAAVTSAIALGRMLRLARAAEAITVVVLLSTPILLVTIGDGYVDNDCLFYHLVGLLASIHYLSTGKRAWFVLAIMGISLAMGTKLSAILPGALQMMALLTVAAYRSRTRSELLGLLMTSAGIAAICFAPWLLLNQYHYGRFLPFKASFGPFSLGSETPIGVWYRMMPIDRPSAYLSELEALAMVFGWPFQASFKSAGILALLAVVTAPFVLLRRLWKSPLFVLQFLALLMGTLLFYYSADFHVVRRHRLFMGDNARFLLAAIVPALLLSIAFAQRSRPIFRMVIVLSLALAIVSFGTAYEYLPKEPILPTVFLTTLCVCCITFAIYRVKSRTQTFLTALCSIVFLKAAAVVATPTIQPSGFPLGPFGELSNPATVAVTGGPDQQADQWLILGLFGSALQNRVINVPISTDGCPLASFPPEARRQNADKEAWLKRILSSNADYLVSFPPRSIEMEWMESHPEIFRLLEGDHSSRGVFEIQKKHSLVAAKSSFQDYRHCSYPPKIELENGAPLRIR